MLTEEMPYCLCRQRALQPGGASMGPGGSFQWFTCTACTRSALHVYFDGGVLLIEKLPGGFTKAHLDYVNGPLMTALRARHERLEQAREVIANRYWDKACDVVGVPRGTTIEHIPKEKYDAWFAEMHYDRDPDWMRPAGAGERFIPPQVPLALYAFTMQRNRSKRWRPVSAEETAAMLVPLDPIRVAHDQYFAEIFEAIRPLADITPTHVANEYCQSPLEPWFRFDVAGAAFTVGPRKRVINIRVEFPASEPLPDLEPIRAAGKRDGTTSEWGPRGGVIHAWNKFRLVEYLTLLIVAAKSRNPSDAVA